MNLEKLLKTTPETLAAEQHAALKEHVVSVLKNTLQAVKDEHYTEIQKLLVDSPAGDGYGCDNHYINFGYNGKESLDIFEVMERLIELKKISKSEK